MGKGSGGIKELAAPIFNPLSFMTTKETEKTKRTEMELASQERREKTAADTAAANAETARQAKIKEDEDALVRRNALLGAVRQRLSGRSSSNTRLSSAEM